MPGNPVSVRDVAERAGVALGTVSNVLNHPDKVAERTRERVHRAIDELGFVRNDAARQLRNGRSRSIGMITLDASNPFFAEMTTAAEDAATARGLAVLHGNSRHDTDREIAYLQLFEEQRTLGVIVSPVGDEVLERLETLRRRGVPVIIVEQDAGGEDFSSVSVDNVEGGRLAVAHLIEQGCRRLLVAGGPQHIRQSVDRVTGARLAADEAGIGLEVDETGRLDVAQGVALAARLVAMPAAERPDGVFCVNDLIAIGLLRALAVDGRVRVPDDVAVIGFDDIDFAAAAAIPLSSVRQPARLIGESAVALLAAEVDGERGHRHIVYPPELVVRDSTRRA